MKTKDFALSLAFSVLPQLALADGPVAAWLYTPDLLGSAEASFEDFDGAVIRLARADSKSEAFMGTVPRFAALCRRHVRDARPSRPTIASPLISNDKFVFDRRIPW